MFRGRAFLSRECNGQLFQVAFLRTYVVAGCLGGAFFRTCVLARCCLERVCVRVQLPGVLGCAFASHSMVCQDDNLAISCAKDIFILGYGEHMLAK